MATRGTVDPRKTRRYGQTHTTVRMIENLIDRSIAVGGVGFAASYGVVGSDTEEITAHNVLDGNYHSDTTIGSVIRGALIVGQGVSPTWKLLSPPATTGKFVVWDGSDTVWSAWALPTSIGSSGEFLAYDGTWKTPTGGTNYWGKSSTDLSPATAGDDIYLRNNECIKLESTGEVAGKISEYFTGDTFLRFDVSSSGILKWGGGSVAGDVQLSRSGANALTLATGDILIADLVQFEGSGRFKGLASAPTPITGYGEVWAKTDGTLWYTEPWTSSSHELTFGENVPPDVSGLTFVTLTDESSTAPNSETLDTSVIVATTGGLSRVVDGAGHVELSSKDPWTTVFKTAQEGVNNDTSLNDDNTLQFAIAASKSYVVQGRIFFTCGAGYLKWGLAVSTFAASNIIGHDVGAQSTATTTDSSTVRNALPTGVTLGSATTTYGYIEFEYRFTTGAIGGTSGLLKFQWCQGASNSAYTYIEAGSYLRFREL